MKGYRELDHTADWALQVWAPDLVGLIRTAIEGMVVLMGVRSGPPAGERTMDLTAPDVETLLFDILTEVLLAIEIDRVLLTPVESDVEALCFRTSCEVRPVEEQAKEIKAVTFNELDIRETERGLETVIVFDV